MYMLCCLVQGQMLLESDVTETVMPWNFMSWSFVTTCHQYDLASVHLSVYLIALSVCD